MDLTELKKEVNKFRERVKTYRDLLSESRDDVMPEIARNFNEINVLRSSLIKDYASLEKYIEKIGKDPKLNDGVWKIFYSPYDNAFTKDTLLRVGPSTDAILDDLDYIIGKLNSMVEEEFKNLFSPQPNDLSKTRKKFSDGNINDLKNPHKEYWEMIYKKVIHWVGENKIFSGIIITVVSGLILAFLLWLI